MKHRIFYGAVLTIACAVSAAFGAEWRLIGKTPGGSTCFVNVSSIRNNYGTISAWIKERYDKPRHPGNGEVVQAVYERETNIQNRTWWIGIGDNYSKIGEYIVKMTDFSTKPSIPDTMDETITDFLVDWCTLHNI